MAACNPYYGHYFMAATLHQQILGALQSTTRHYRALQTTTGRPGVCWCLLWQGINEGGQGANLATRTQHTLLSGSCIMYSKHRVLFCCVASRLLSHSLKIHPPFKSCSTILMSNLLPCSRGRCSCSDTLKRVLAIWSSWRLGWTCRIWLLSIISTRIQLLMKKSNMKKY